jgi:hypothetical protein
MSNKETFDRIRQSILSQLEAHRGDIEDGKLGWFRIRVFYSHNDLRIVWDHEEKSYSVNGEGDSSYLRR